jgi:glycosyltransferase involved in cell wall biosynthesis
MIQEILAKCHLYIQPSKSENFSHSIYDALMTGRPVITSHFTPWNNLFEKRAGVNVAVDDVTELTKAIEDFAAMEFNQMQEWSKGARSYASKAIDMETTKKQYIEMFSA